MVASSWKLRVNSASKVEIQAWLDCEVSGSYTLQSSNDEVTLDFHNIDDAFRFRLHFDEAINLG